MKRIAFSLFLSVCLASQSWAQDAVALIQRSPMITIAASNTPAAKRRTADFVCDGTNDEATILLALARLRGAGSVSVPGDNQIAEAAYNSQGGTIFFCSGEYNIQSTLTISLQTAPHAVRLDGEAGATIHVNTTDETPGIVWDGAAATGATHGYNRPEVQNLTFVGNFDETSPATPHCGDLMQMNDVAFPHVMNCHFLKAGRDGFHMTTPNNGAIAPQNRIIQGNQFVGCARHGLFVSDSHDLIISNCQVEENARKAGSGGAGIYLSDIVGGTMTTVMTEDNDSEFNTDALALKIVDTALNMIGVDCEGEATVTAEIDVRPGLNFKMTNCHFTKTLDITGNNSNITLESVDAATSISCSMSTYTQGAFKMIGGRCGTLTLDIGTAILNGVDVTTLFKGSAGEGVRQLSVTGGKLVLGDMNQVLNASFIGVSPLTVDTGGTAEFRTQESLSIVGGAFEPAANMLFSFDSNCRILIETGWNHQSGTVTFDRATAGQSGMRMILNSNLRGAAINITEIDYLSMSGTMTGGTINVSECLTAMTLTGMAMGGSPTINFADCDGRGIMKGCTGTSGTITRDTCPLYADTYFVGTDNPGITISAATP